LWLFAFHFRRAFRELSANSKVEWIVGELRRNTFEFDNVGLPIELKGFDSDSDKANYSLTLTLERKTWRLTGDMLEIYGRVDEFVVKV
jgi:hypothetical protein